MRNLTTILFCTILAAQLFSQSGSTLYDDSFVHEIHLEISLPNFWDTLLYDYEQIEITGEKRYIPASVTIDGNSLDSVGIRIKGFLSAWGTEGKKKPLKIDFNEFLPDQEYEGLKKINLQNSFDDPSSMRDRLAYNIFNTANVNASRTAYSRVYINGNYWGLYLIVEQIDKTFLEERFFDNSGNLYKAMNAGHLIYNGSTSDSYTDYIELKTNKTANDWSRFIEFVEVLNREYLSNDDEYEVEMANIFNINSYLKVLAIDILLLNWDSYYAHGRNYYIYDNPAQQKFVWIPWDYNLSFSESPIDILVSENWGEALPLIHNLLDRPIFLQAYVDAYKEILENNFTPERLFPIIDSTENLISESLRDDPNKFFSHEAFKACLDKDTMVKVYDTWTNVFEAEKVFFSNSNTTQEQLDSAWAAGANVIDTTWADNIDITIDTVIFHNDTTINYIIVETWEYERFFLGIKPFIERRIGEVKREISEVIIPEDPNAITELVNNSSIVVYPNPATDFIIVSGINQGTPFSTRLVDVSGKIISESENEEILNLKDISPGIYFLEVDTEEGAIVKKFLKK